MRAEPAETIPLYARRRLIGSAFGGYRSIRRGEGSDVAGSRPYQPGDHFHTIDWKASARLSSARGADEFIVRERFSEEMPRVVLICDRRPEMALFPRDLPWLHKPEAVEHAAELVVASALNQRGLVGYLDYGGHEGETDAGTPCWHPPRAQSNLWFGDLVELTRTYLGGRFDAPPDNIDQALRFLAAVGGTVPIGSFVFVLSDFLVRPSQDAWAGAFDRGWDVVPVIVQDPLWEQSFPPLEGCVVPIADADDGRLVFVHLTRREAEARRAANKARMQELVQELDRFGLDHVLVSASSREAVRQALLSWAGERLAARGSRE